MDIPNDSIPALTISVVGAGIAGLTAAIAIRRNGHLVQVFETSEIKTEIGAALGLQPNAMRVLDHLGISRDNLKGVEHIGHIAFTSDSGDGQTARFGSGGNELPGLLCHRSDVHNELTRLAVGEGKGPAVEIRLGSKVVACDTEEGTITLDSGEVVRADIVLGADGVNSVIRTEILGSEVPAAPSGWSCFRTVFEAQEVPELEWLTGEVSGARSVIVKEGPFRMFIIYPCRSGRLVNFIGFFTDSPESEAGWTPTGSREEILETFGDFHPKFLRVLDLPSHSAIHKWKLRVVPLLPTWIRGRTALLGDAAHATTPFLAQGAGMAIEEAGSLGCLLPLGTRREDIPARLEAYQDIRKDRGDFARKESVEQVARMLSGTGWYKAMEVQNYLREYDAIKATQEYYEERFSSKSLSN
ncbi:FAD/NAD(P)-binding domain-containing protein [Mycena latifolia]|nr:FAD/NAD(P)-binding domain-containing protein [Mycena latifolia]